MTFRLPPLTTLRFFEAAGRLGGFARASAELRVTPSAVGHAVQALEDWLGARLFTRTARGLVLTPAGAAYLPEVRRALAILDAASDRLPEPRRRSDVCLSVAPTFGARILLPRLAGFHACHPGVAVHLDSSHRLVGFPHADGADVAIRMGSGAWPGLSAVRLFRERLAPVCTAAVRARRGEGQILPEAPLIHVTSISHDWAAWAQATGASLPAGARALMVDSIQMAIDAAGRGLGIMMGRLPLMQDDLTEGRLVPAGGSWAEVESAYWLVAPSATLERPEIAAFRDWLADEMATFARGCDAVPPAAG